MAEYTLEIEGLNKSFGPTHANRNIHLKLEKGEIRGFAGENGSGKSTLASIICGIQPYDSGFMKKNGASYNPKTPMEANACKVAMVVQELGVVGNLPVYLNMFLGRTEQFKKLGIINMKKMEKTAELELEKWGIKGIPLTCKAESLSIEQRKMIELVRALSIEPDLLILDEITQALSHDNREKLYQIMKEFTKKGNTIFLITHDIEEMIMLSDNITVLRDGEITDTVESRDGLDPDKLKNMMIGREINNQYYRLEEKASYSEELVLSVKDLNVKNRLSDINFDLHKGEILAVCGLSDAGIHTLGKAIFQLEEHTTGEIYAHKFKKQIKKPIDILDTHGAFLSKDRDADGLMLSGEIRHNIFMPSVGSLAKTPIKFVNPGMVDVLTEKARKTFEIKCQGTEQIVKRLSGGNKQKVNLGRWLIKDLDYVILDCPTRGVDVGVKAYIYEIMNKAKKRGMAILLISDELTEAMGMADNIMVMKNGSVVKTISRNVGFTEEAIIEEML